MTSSAAKNQLLLETMLAVFSCHIVKLETMLYQDMALKREPMFETLQLQELSDAIADAHHHSSSAEKMVCDDILMCRKAPTSKSLLDNLVEISGFSMGCLIHISTIVYSECSAEICRPQLDVSSLEAYSASIEKELWRIINQSTMIKEFTTLIDHQCPPMNGYLCAKGCRARLPYNSISQRIEKRALMQTIRMQRTRNSILKQHIKLPLTTDDSRKQRLYPDHAKLMKDVPSIKHKSLSSDSKSIVNILVLLFDPKMIVGHVFYVPVEQPYSEKVTYANLLALVLRELNGYLTHFTLKKEKAIDIKLSRYDMSLIDEKNPHFEDGEILWINHFKHDDGIKECECCEPTNLHSEMHRKWRVLSHKFCGLDKTSEPILLVPHGYCNWCLSIEGEPCENCGLVYFCSNHCRDMYWPTHYLTSCRSAVRLTRDPAVVLEEAEKILQDIIYESCSAVLVFADDDESVVEGLYIHLANNMYQRLIMTGKVTFRDNGPEIDADRHYDPVCLIYHLICFRMSLHRFITEHFPDGFDEEEEVEVLLEVASTDFLNMEAANLAHHCVNKSRLPTEVPCHHDKFKRFSSMMFNNDGLLGIRSEIPFTNSDPEHAQILYDMSYPKCHLMRTLTSSKYRMSEGEVVTNKVITILVLDDMTEVRCQHFRFLPETGPYNLKQLEADILKELKSHRCGSGLSAIYDAIKLSRHDLRLITGEMVDFDDGEVIMVNHVHYSNHWRVSIHETKLKLADPRLCMWCYSKPGKACQGCKVGMYCSRECQTIHWSMHRFDCKGNDKIFAQVARGHDPFPHFASDLV